MIAIEAFWERHRRERIDVLPCPARSGRRERAGEVA